jgi:uncharacterized protein (TIGR03067 family)
MTRLALFGLVAAIALAAGPAPAAPIPRGAGSAGGDKAKLQGRWKVESMRMGEQDLTTVLGANFEMFVEFDGDRLAAEARLQGRTTVATTADVTYDVPKKQFRTTNSRSVDANGKPAAQAQKEESMGYAFDGEKLILSQRGAGAAGLPGKNDVVMVLTRVKK